MASPGCLNEDRSEGEFFLFWDSGLVFKSFLNLPHKQKSRTRRLFHYLAGGIRSSSLVTKWTLSS